MNESTAFGRWTRDEWGLPAFRFEPHAPYDRQGRTSRIPWYRAGNDALWFQASAAGWIRLYETSRGRRAWHDQAAWAEIDGVATTAGVVPTFGAGYARFQTNVEPGLLVDRLLFAPYGDTPFLLCRIEVRPTDGRDHSVRWHERWPLRPLWLSAPSDDADRRAALAAMRYRRVSDDHLTLVEETRDEAALRYAIRAGVPLVPPSGGRVWLAWLGGREAMTEFAWTAGDRALSTVFTLELGAESTWCGWQMCGVGDPAAAGDLLTGRHDPGQILEEHFGGWRATHTSVTVPGVTDMEREIEWAGVSLRQAVVRDDTVGTFVDPGGRHAAPVGMAVARDVALCGVAATYVFPEIARSTLLSLLQMGDADADITWATFGAGIRHDMLHSPADFDLWVLWLAVEYMAATGDVGVLDQPVASWPQQAVLDLWPDRFGHRKAGPERTVRDQLAVHVRHVVDFVGLGPTGLVRAGADPQVPFVAPGVDPGSVESVPATAQARWILPRLAAWFDRAGDHGAAKEARELSDILGPALARAGASGRWPEILIGGAPVQRGTTLAAQVWPVLAGLAPEPAEALLDVIAGTLRADSPLGTRSGPADTSVQVSVRPDLSSLLVWAAARHAPALARDELGRMRLAAHAESYPDQWIGVFSGAGAWEAPESPRSGLPPEDSDDDDPIATGPSADARHPAALLLAAIRLFGIEPGPDGLLRITPARAAGACRIRTPVVEIDVSESGRRFDGRYRFTADGDAVVGESARRFAAGWNTL
ncbi:MAG: hypothetical protein IT198_05000 [Acidimicrobiia bacterium]|nr:hypothetical protein [Acidimicrobiia bacterium]